MGQAARDIAVKEFLPHSTTWDKQAHFPLDKLRLLGELGYGGMFVADTWGGLDLSRTDAAAIFENFAYGDVPLTAYLTIHNMVGRILNLHASEAAKERLLPRVAALQLLTSYCLTEPSSGSDAAAMATTAMRNADGSYRISGSKAFISGGGVSDLYLVLARTGAPHAKQPGRGVTAFIVGKDTPGVSFGGQEEKMGWKCQPTCTVHFDGAGVPADQRVGEEGEGFKIAMAALDSGRINIGACSIGGAQMALDRTLEYCGQRKQFQARLDDFQHSQFKLADCATRVVSSRLLIHQAAAALDAKDSNGTLLAAMAKRLATDECFRVVDDCLQLHGGYGYIRDYMIEQRLRDLRVHSILEGTNEVMRHVIWRQMRKQAAS